MKIVSIKFLNLNSLKGEHEIRFDQPPFTESGLFAITGPTGAGKTTILDAITLAMYGEVHRHDKGDPSEIMTRHTAESYSEVEFEVKNILYRSKWSNYRARKKADGRLQGVKMELSNTTTNEIIESNSLARFNSKIVEISGLDYNQFLRSVILSQGDFTRFLKASENERSDLLEKITDTDIYSKISIFTFEKTKDEKVQLEALRTRLNDVVLLPDDERNAHRLHITELTEEERGLKLAEMDLKQKLDWLRTLQQIIIRKQELLTALQDDEQFYVNNEAQFQKLQLHRQALVYKPALAEINAVEVLINKINKDVREQNTQLPALQSIANEILQTLEIAKLLTEATQKELSEIEPVFETVIRKDAIIESAKHQFTRTRNAFEQDESSVDQFTQLQTQVATKLLNVSNRLSKLEGWLKENEQDGSLDKELIVFTNCGRELKDFQTSIDEAYNNSMQYKSEINKDKELFELNEKNCEKIIEKINHINQENISATEKLELAFGGKTLEEFESNLNEFPRLINVCEQQLRLANNIKQNEIELNNLDHEQELNKGLNIKEEGELKQIKEDKIDATEKLKNLQEIFELEVRIQKYDADREKLQPEKPCPLCGSEHHPYVHNNYKSHLSEVDQRRNEQRQTVEKLIYQVDKKALQVNTLYNKLEAGEVQLQKLQGAISTALAEFEENNQQLPKPVEMEKPEIIIALITKKQEQLHELRQLVKEIRELQQMVGSNETAISKQRELLAQAEGKVEQAKIRMTHSERQIANIQKETEKLEEKKNGIEKNMTSLLKQYNLVFDYNKINNIVSTLSGRFGKYKTCDTECKQLELEKRQLETEQKNANESLEEKQKLLKVQAAHLNEEQEILQHLESERFELFGNKNPNIERERLNKTLKEGREQIGKLIDDVQQKQQQVSLIEDRILNWNKDLVTYNENLAAQLLSLVTRLQENGIASIESLRLLFMDDEEAKAIDLLQKEAAQKIATGKSLLTTTENNLQLETDKKLTKETEEDLLPKIEMQSLSLSKLNQQIGKVRQILEEDDNLKVRHQQVAGEIERQRKEFERWNKLSALIGSADGKKFSRFAQGLTLARLTGLANRHLLRLSDRYQILKSPEKDLELQIIDGYQADVVRPMSTLSGGESFLVSLALALGLSDLASRKVQINSLFIDEGFGTLDSDTLDIAISALENLQANGKSIGIISHVDALKERIGTQIQVSKQAGGSSKIRLFNYDNEVIEL